MVIKLLYLHGFLICLWWYLCCRYSVSKRKLKLILVTVYMSFHSTIFDCNYLYICRQFLKAGFCSQQSQSCRWSDKIAYDLVKIANWSCKQCGKDDGIVLGRVRMFPFFFHLHNDIIGYNIQWKLGCLSWKQYWKNQPITKSRNDHCHWFILLFLFAPSTMQFSLHHEQWRHNKNQCSASNSAGFTFTRFYCATLLISTPTQVCC